MGGDLLAYPALTIRNILPILAYTRATAAGVASLCSIRPACTAVTRAKLLSLIAASKSLHCCSQEVGDDNKNNSVNECSKKRGLAGTEEAAATRRDG